MKTFRFNIHGLVETEADSLRRIAGLPDAINTPAHALVNSIKNGEGNMNQATTAAAAESPPLT